MNSLRYFSVISFWLIAISISAQDFKVIEETKDYILKVADSAYYYSHGLPPKDDFVIDTTKIHKVNGVLKLPLDNRKEVVFRDIEFDGEYKARRNTFEGENKELGYYLISSNYYDEGGNSFLINIKNGTIDTLEITPIFSPSKLYFGNCFCDMRIPDRYVTFNNIKKNKSVKIIPNDAMVGFFKWINDLSFLYNSCSDDPSIERINRIKYYLVQIKQ